MIRGRQESIPTVAKVLQAIGLLKDDNAAGIDEIRSEMLKLMGKVGGDWLTRVIKLAEWEITWQVGVIMPVN